MKVVRRLLGILAFIVFIAAANALASVAPPTIFITQTGSPSGNCTTNVQTPAFFNNSANWGTGAGQIGPGTTVLVCGTFSSSTHGGNVLTVQGSGAAGSPITILFDTNAQMTSTGWWGSYNADACPSCTGAITVNGHSYITIDGGANGIIQNTLSGSAGNTCLSGPCSVQPGSSGSLGIHLAGDNLIVRNLTIQHIYDNAGSSSSASDTAGHATADIRFDGGRNIEVANNTLNNARAGLWGGASGTAGIASCPLAGICIHDNKVADHGWSMILNGSGTVNVYANEIGDISGVPGWLNWDFPTGAYHQDGLFLWGDTGKVTYNVWNNYIHGDMGLGSPSGLIYCANNGVSGSGTGCALTAFNNLLVLTGSGGSGSSGDQAFAFKFDVSGASMGPMVLYNNTVVGGRYGIELYTPGTSATSWSIENNVFTMGLGGYYFNQSNSGTTMSSVTANGNIYHNGNSMAWGLNGAQYGSLSGWQTACACDSNGIAADPQLTSSYMLGSSSPAIALGVDLTGVNISPLDWDKAGTARPGAPNGPPPGNWSAGAYEFSSSTSTPPAPPSGLTALIQ